MYYAFSIPDSLREKILQTFPAVFPEIICEHCTLIFSAFNNTKYETNTPYTIRIYTMLSNEKVQCVLCSIDGEYERPKDGYFHITVSIDREKGAKPVMSNQLIADYYNNDPNIKIEKISHPIMDLVYLKSYD